MLVLIVAAGLSAMGVYGTRSVSGKLRESMDSVGEQYDPIRAQSSFTTTITSDSTTESILQKDRALPGGGTGDVMATKTTLHKEETTQSGTETIDALQDSLWK